MRILSTTDVDLISPFPIAEIPHLYSWMRAYRSMVESDLSPKDLPSFTDHMARLITSANTYGVIDRNNTLGFRHDVPIIGFIMYEPAGVWNSYIHLATNRRAWASGYIEQAVKISASDQFETYPELLRLSGFCLSNNSPVRNLSKRLGWQFEGVMKDMISQNNQPKTIVHYGLTRSVWKDSEDYPKRYTELFSDSRCTLTAVSESK